MDNEPNQTTIEAYNNGVGEYISKTPPVYQPHHQAMLKWIDAALDNLPGKNVLEIGSATLRDASYIRSKGFSVKTSDASKEFLRHLQEMGEAPLTLNALTDPLPAGYNLFFANAVAPHFTHSDMIKFLDKVSHTLKPGDRLAFNLKSGKGEEWINEKLTARRFIHYWQPTDIEQLLHHYRFKILFFESNALGDLPTHHWINIVVEK